MTPDEINAVAEQVVRIMDAERNKHWYQDEKKRNRVIFVLIITTVAMLMEHIGISWTHRIWEVSSDCVIDFLAFGTIET